MSSPYPLSLSFLPLPFPQMGWDRFFYLCTTPCSVPALGWPFLPHPTPPLLPLLAFLPLAWPRLCWIGSSPSPCLASFYLEPPLLPLPLPPCFLGMPVCFVDSSCHHRDCLCLPCLLGLPCPALCNTRCLCTLLVCAMSIMGTMTYPSPYYCHFFCGGGGGRDCAF